MGEFEVKALKNISLEIEPGEFVAITGPSGGGKSTLLHIMGLLDIPDTGRYILSGHDVSNLSGDLLAAYRNEYIGFVFQMFNLLPRVSAYDNVELPLLYTPKNKRKNYPLPGKLLEKTGLGDRMEHHPNELSGGQQQRVAIARAVLKNPDLILADEPTGNLDTATAKDIMEILEDLNRSGKTLVMVTHEEELAARAERIIRLRDGEIIEDKKVKKRNKAGKENLPHSKHEVKKHRFNFYQTRSYFAQAIKSLVSNKVRSFLSILGVMIGVTAVIAMLALGTGAREDVQQRLAHMGANVLSVSQDRRFGRSAAAESGISLRLEQADAEALKRSSLLIRASGVVSGNVRAVYMNRNMDTDLYGVMPDYEHMRDVTPLEGRFFSHDEVMERSRVAVLGHSVANELFPGEVPLGQTIRINRINFNVIGVLPEKGTGGRRDPDEMILVPLNTAMYRVLGKRNVDYIDVEAVEGAMPLVEKEIRDIITTRHRIPGRMEEIVRIRNWAEMQDAIADTARTFSWLLGSIAFISLLVGGIGIMNIMLVAVTERTREVGLRKAVGANRRDILSQFLIEAVAICFTGGLMGIALGWGISSALAEYAGWSTRIAASSVFLAVGFSVGIGVFFGLWPAKKAANLNPIDALRYE